MPKRSGFAQNARDRMGTSLDDLKSPLFWRAVIAELLGTTFLVILGAGSCMVWDNFSGRPSDLHIALAFGLAVATIMWAIGHLSGGHINPAVTAGFLVTRRISLIRALLFMVFQVLGAALGAGILVGITPKPFRGQMGLTQPHEEVGPGTALGVEFLITFALVFTVFATFDEKRRDLNGSGPLAVGLTVTVCHLFALRYSGASLNPARSFGVALATHAWKEHWVYWCGPMIGGVVAALLYDNVFASNASMDKAKEYLLASVYDPAKHPENPERPAKVTFADDVPGGSLER